MCLCVCVVIQLWSVCSGVEEPELVLSLHQSAMKQEKEDGCETERETQSQEAATRINEDTKEEKSEGETELQAPDADVTLDFADTGMSFTGAETSALGDAPLYNDVMMPSTSVLSPPSPPTEPPCGTLPRLEDFPFPSSSAPASSGRSSTQVRAASAETPAVTLPGVLSWSIVELSCFFSGGRGSGVGDVGSLHLHGQ